MSPLPCDQERVGFTPPSWRFGFVDCSERDKGAIRGIPGPRYTKQTKGAYISNLLRQKWFRCEHCGRLFRNPRRVVGKNGHTNQWCSKTCAGLARREANAAKRREGQPYSEIPWKDCPICQKGFIARHGKAYCSNSCGWKAAHRRLYGPRLEAAFYKKWKGKILKCEECLREFEPQWKKSLRYCSPTCSARLRNRNERHTRRARIQAKRHESISLPKLVRRDAGICHICGGKTKGNKWPGGASIDHLVPLCKGGSHTWDNVALAHIKCNTLRGVDGPAQLRLL